MPAACGGGSSSTNAAASTFKPISTSSTRRCASPGGVDRPSLSAGNSGGQVALGRLYPVALRILIEPRGELRVLEEFPVQHICSLGLAKRFQHRGVPVPRFLSAENLQRVRVSAFGCVHVAGPLEGARQEQAHVPVLEARVLAQQRLGSGPGGRAFTRGNLGVEQTESYVRVPGERPREAASVELD